MTMKKKYRCCPGVKINVTPERTLYHSVKSPTQGKSEEDRLSFRTPSPRTSSRSQKMFTPFFDILENGKAYVVRIILPLMDSEQARRIKFESNLTQKYLRVSGPYIPGCHIGDKLTRQFSIRAPLRPCIPAPSQNCGWFDLKIPLPSDIKDDALEVAASLVTWGLAVHLPRRKQMGEVAVQLSTCFGTADLGVEKTAIKETRDQNNTTDEVTTRSTDTVQLVSTKEDMSTHKTNEKAGLPKSSKPSKKRGSSIQSRTNRGQFKRRCKGKKITKQDLVGRRFLIEGAQWSEQWAGKTYTAEIKSIYRSSYAGGGDEEGPEEFDVFRVEVDGEVEPEAFYLSDLLHMGGITEAEHDGVKDSYDYWWLRMTTFLVTSFDKHMFYG